MRTLIVVICLLVLPTEAVAQTAVSNGHLVRVHRRGAETVTGVLREITSQEIVVLVRPARQEVTIKRAEIDRVLRSRGVGPDFPRSFTLSLGATSLGGAALGWLTWRDSGRSAESFEAGSRGEAAAFGFAAGLVLGLPVAVLAGVLLQHERWEGADVPWGNRMDWSIGPAHAPGGGLAVSARIRLGGH